ncbi:hypothetical protein M9434_003597 [Picochlorum sp. BPE23]|nr:hypothetical protein M9434_003597 [Picochlorum sp. BPE23]
MLVRHAARFGYTHALVSDRGTTRVPLRQPFVKFHANQSSHCGGILGADALTLCLAVPQGQRSLVEENVRDVVVRVYNVSVSAPKDPGKDDFDVHQELLESIRKKLKLRSTKPLAEHGNVAIVRKAFDSRDKSRKKWIYVVDIPLRALDGKKIVESQGKIEIMEVCKDHVNWNRVSNGQASKKSDPVVVVGSGPAGLFAALSIAKSGIPVTILERGRPVEDRGRDIGALFARKKLNPESNLCYGEGGAGTWSDGKLTTRIGRNNDPVRQVLETLCLFGAPNAILYSGKPHLGTDRLIGILRSFRHHLRDLGVKIEFESKVKTLEIKNGRVVGVLLEDGTGFSCQKCILAVGHSARQMYEHLADLGVKMEAKPFAMGFRIEHPQAVIDAIQYGKEDAENLVKRGKGPIPVADYKLTTNLSDRGIYSFCMCPGGQIVPTSTNEAELCINGMSFSKRNSIWANSALVATISETDWEPFENGHPALSGVNLQKHIERRAAHMGGGNLICPVQRVVDFLSDRESVGKLPSSSYRLGVKSASLHTLYSAELTEAIKQALFKFDTIKPGFICEDALLHAAETRTSSPVQITRHPESFESVSIKGLYPAGEGAGYAGGIVSACVDGLKIGNSIVQQVAS